MSYIQNEKFNQLMDNEAFVREMLSQENEEAVQKLYAKHGVILTIDEVREIGKVLNSFETKEELDASDLDEVAGGIVIAAATCWAVAKAAIAIGGAGLAIYKWY